MLYPIGNVEDLKNSDELASLQNQVKAIRLQDKLGEQKFHEFMKKVFEPYTESLENTSENITKTITETSIENKQAKENLNNKLLEIMMDRGILKSCLVSPLSIITNPETTSQFKLVEDSSSHRFIHLLLHNKIPVTLYNNLLTTRDTDKKFELKKFFCK